MTRRIPAHAVTGLTTSGSGAVAASAVSYAGAPGLSATNVEAALDELDAEKATVGHTHAAQTASQTPFTPGGGIAATNVQAALAELDTEKLDGTDSVNALADVDTTTTPPTDGDVLTWDGTAWVPAAVVDGGTL